MKYFFIIIFLSLSLYAAYSKSADENNIYYESPNFRVIAGVSYENSLLTKELAYKILDNAELSWLQLVQTQGFKTPNGYGHRKTDIYIGDRSAYIDEFGIYVTIGSSYAGWTNYYEDKTPYIVINPRLDSDNLKATIAHEFFHCIHYAYFDAEVIVDQKWNKSVWWLEATAMMAEDEVFDELNLYIGYLYSFFNYSYKSIETYNGIHEYAMVVFAKYIKERFGIELIKESFSMIMQEQFDGYFDVLDYLLQRDFDSSMKKALHKFAKWVYKPQDFFEEGDIYPTLRKYNLNNINTVGKGGIVVFENTPGIFVKSSSTYSFTTSKNQEYIVSSDDHELLLSNFSTQSIEQADLLRLETTEVQSLDNTNDNGFFVYLTDHGRYSFDFTTSTEAKLYKDNTLFVSSGGMSQYSVTQTQNNSYIHLSFAGGRENIKFYGLANE